MMKYPDDFINQFVCGDNSEVMKDIPDNSIDLVVTSPPYDKLRQYEGFVFDFEKIALELIRTLRKGGVIVWVVADATVKGSETGTSFKQALFFKDNGLRLHDTMIWYKPNPIPLTHNRYEQSFEYMFIFSKGKPKTFNPLMTQSKGHGAKKDWSGVKNPEKTYSRRVRQEITTVKKYKYKHNVFSYNIGGGKYYHPAIFPEQLAKDHIKTWSKENEIVLDPFMGSGTTAKAAISLERQWIGIEVSEEYIEIAKKRIESVQLSLIK